MKAIVQYVSKSRMIQGIQLTESELKGFAYMITSGAPKGFILDYIKDDRIHDFLQLELIYKDPSIIITDYFYISSKYINEIIFLFFDTFYRSMPVIKNSIIKSSKNDNMD